MRIFCLGGTGRICRESVLDLMATSSFEQITVGDLDEGVFQEIEGFHGDSRVSFVKADVRDKSGAVEAMRGYDIVIDGLPISMNAQSTACIAEAGAHGINLNGFGPEWDLSDAFAANGKVCIPGYGMTPGVTNSMAMHAANQLDSVDEIYVSHGAFRPIAFSKSIAETTCVEYDPDYPDRVVFEDGELKHVPPFARPRTVELPEPFGTHPQYIIPHPETVTLPRTLTAKGVRLVETRGTWPPRNMALLRQLYDWGILRNEKVDVDGAEVGVMDALAAYLCQSKEGTTTDLCGYALHVEVVGAKDGQRAQHVLTTTHPASDGSVADWADLRAYTRSVGIPMSIAAQLIARGEVSGTGTVAPESAFDPGTMFAELEKRDILVHERITPL